MDSDKDEKLPLAKKVIIARILPAHDGIGKINIILREPIQKPIPNSSMNYYLDYCATIKYTDQRQLNV